MSEPGGGIAALYVRSRDLKMLREALCSAQALMLTRRSGLMAQDVRALEHLIHEIDLHRPLDEAGVHGDLHTPTCGCEDKT